jgi:hypothetical protein
VQKAGSADHQKVIDALKAGGTPGVLLPEYRFDANGDVIGGPLYIYAYETGAFKLIETYKAPGA